MTDEIAVPLAIAMGLVGIVIAFFVPPSRGGTLLAFTLLLVLGCLMLAGCSATATYTAPTGQQATCVRPANYPGSGLLGLLTAPLYAMAEYDAATQYSQCKTALEAQGWERTP